jgi:hypothetical protein
MEIDVASYLDSAHGAKSRLRGMARITATMSALGPASDRQIPLPRLAETIEESLEPAQ